MGSDLRWGADPALPGQVAALVTQSVDWPGVLDALVDLGIYVTDCERRIVFWNRAAEAITGWKREQVTGTACHDNLLCHEDRHGRKLCLEGVCPLHQSMKRVLPRSVESIVFAHGADGKKVPMKVMIAPIVRDGVVVGGLEVFRPAWVEHRQQQLAERVQRSLLPDPAALARLAPIAFHYCPAETIGGDYLRIFPLGDGRLAGLIADVSGHGAASALITTLIHGSLHELEARVEGLSRLTAPGILAHLARSYDGLGLTDHYFTAHAFVLAPGAARLSLASAGHPAPVLVGNDGTASFCEVIGNPIGLVPDPEFTTFEFDLQGRRLVLYSDGLVEAHDPRGEELGDERFLAAVVASARRPAGELARRLCDDALAFTEGPEPGDDLTCVVIDGSPRG